MGLWVGGRVGWEVRIGGAVLVVWWGWGLGLEGI